MLYNTPFLYFSNGIKIFRGAACFIPHSRQSCFIPHWLIGPSCRFCWNSANISLVVKCGPSQRHFARILVRQLPSTLKSTTNVARVSPQQLCLFCVVLSACKKISLLLSFFSFFADSFYCFFLTLLPNPTRNSKTKLLKLTRRKDTRY